MNLAEVDMKVAGKLDGKFPEAEGKLHEVEGKLPEVEVGKLPEMDSKFP